MLEELKKLMEEESTNNFELNEVLKSAVTMSMPMAPKFNAMPQSDEMLDLCDEAQPVQKQAKKQQESKLTASVAKKAYRATLDQVIAA